MRDILIKVMISNIRKDMGVLVAMGEERSAVMDQT